MTLLILGLLLWSLPHLAKRLIPDQRARWGNPGKGVIALLIGAGVVAMILGYRSADFVPLYAPLPGMGHANNTLMLVSLFLFGVGGTKGVLYTRMRHPMLWGQVVWAAAHLLVNGDLASVVLFGGLGLWALAEMALINRTPWTAPQDGRGLKGDAMNLAGTLVLLAIIAFVHQWLGHPVFEGTYF